ncbi:hypothetical protein PR002_g29470 [Phytophthora rubi]|uniref:Uncharacterized protein n=1 Tax=Phytophthora rubi TaxID=129364 RepID=A0A6A3H0Q0_9STRA|nr:hypothetical protein PR002_g29470 [Phytophthora rubi]
MLSMRAGIELEKCEEIECTILGLHLLLTTDSTTCSAASKKNSGFVLFAAVQVVDVNSLAASRVKIIQTDVNEDVYPYLTRKWFQLVDDGGNALTSADAVPVDIEDVVALRDDVFAKVCRALPTMSSRPTSKSSQ